MEYRPKQLKNTVDISSGDHKQLFTWQNALNLVLIFCLVFFFSRLLDYAAARLPDSFEASWFANKKSHLLKESDKYPDYSEKINGILLRLLKNNEHRDLPYKISVIDMPIENAFAALGGKIYVTKKLIEDTESEQALAFVIAHELGHHELRHCLRDRAQQILWYALMTLFSTNNNEVFTTTKFLTMQNSSRAWETEADLIALDFLRNSYSDLGNFLEFFEKRAVGKSQITEFDQNYFGSHPASSKRIENIKTVLEKKL